MRIQFNIVVFHFLQFILLAEKQALEIKRFDKFTLARSRHFLNFICEQGISQHKI